jgi:DNA polymerase III subunit gamma/tau
LLKTYVPLYRKYRPQSFQDLVGQGTISQTLSNAIMQNKVAHAYLFTGPRGTGKTSAARIMAKSLNCETGPTVSPCGQCSSCKDITSGNALDVIEIDAASNNSVADARDLIDRVQFAPVAGRYKVYIIDEVHMLTSQAFNTLLKTLEEPPPNLVFILATTESHKVLETIISRCQRFDFRRISQDAMVARLQHISELENIQITSEALNLIARRAAGGLRDALGLLDQISVLSQMGQIIEIKDVLNLIGALPEDMLINLSRAIAEKDGGEVLNLINQLMILGNEPLQIIKELTIHFRNLLIASTVKQDLKDIVDASQEFYDELKTIAQTFKVIEIAQIIDKLAYAERMIRNTTQPILWLEVGILSITYRHEIHMVEELQQRVEKLEQILTSGNVPADLALSYVQQIKPIRIEPRREVPVPEVKTMPLVEKQPVTPLKEEALLAKPEKIDMPVKADLPEQEKIDVPPEPVKAEIIKKESKEKEEPVLEASPPEKAITSEKVEAYPLDATWQAIVNAITFPPLKGMLNSSGLVMPMAVTSHEIVIGFTQEWILNDLGRQNRKAMLETAIKQVLGTLPRLVLKLISEKEYKESRIKIETAIPAKPVRAEKAKTTETVAVKHEEDVTISAPKLVEEPPEHDTPVEGVIETPVSIQVPVNVEYSEQVKLVQDIFQGKILDS